MNKILALIPARYASTRFPGKPLAEIAGKPMIRRVWERAAAVYGADCYVATDDERIAQAVRAFGGRAVMTSPDHASGTDRCCEALDAVESMTGARFDVALNVQGDEPFVSEGQLRTLAALFDDPRVQIGTLVRPFGPDEDIFNPNSPKVVLSTEGYALYFSRLPIPYLRSVPDQKAWQGAHTYYRHLGMYAYRREVLHEISALKPGALEQAESLEQLRWLENGYRIKAGVTTDPSHGVDTPDDLAAAERFYRENSIFYRK